MTRARVLLKRFEFKPLCDLRYGPWAGQGSHRILKNAAFEFFDVETSDGVLFSLFYEEYLKDSGGEDPDEGSATHRLRIWRRWRTEMLHAPMGGKVKDGRWWNLEGRGMTVMKQRLPLLMILTWYGFRRGWWYSLSETPLLKLDTFNERAHADCHAADPEEVDEEEAAQDSNAEEEEVEEEEAAGAEPQAVPLQTDQEMSAKNARETLAERRKEMKSTMYYSCVALSDETGCRLFTGLCHLNRPLMRRFGVEEETMMSLQQHKILVTQLATKGYDVCVHDYLNFVLEPDFAAECSLRCGFLSMGRIQSDRRIGDVLWSVLTLTAGELVKYHATYQVPPLLFLSLNNTDAEEKQAALRRCKKILEAMLAFESLPRRDKWACNFYRDAVLPSEQWVREILFQFHAHDFSADTPNVFEQIAQYAEHWHATLFTERSFNFVRRREKRVTSKKWAPLQYGPVSGTIRYFHSRSGPCKK